MPLPNDATDDSQLEGPRDQNVDSIPIVLEASSDLVSYLDAPSYPPSPG